METSVFEVSPPALTKGEAPEEGLGQRLPPPLLKGSEGSWAKNVGWARGLTPQRLRTLAGHHAGVWGVGRLPHQACRGEPL